MAMPMGLFRGADNGRANPANRPALEFRGNSAHSSGFYAPTYGACMYQGGWLRYNVTTNNLDFSSGLYARSTWDSNAPATMLWRDTKLWRCNGGVTWWGSSVELRGLEAHDSHTALLLLDALVNVTNALISGGETGVSFTRAASSAALQRVTFRGFSGPGATALVAGAQAGPLLLDAVSFENTPRSAVQLLASNVTILNPAVVPARAPCAMPWDLNGDGYVDGADVGVLLSHWGSIMASDSALDCNDDGFVSVVDVTCALDAFVTKWFSL